MHVRSLLLHARVEGQAVNRPRCSLLLAGVFVLAAVLGEAVALAATPLNASSPASIATFSASDHRFVGFFEPGAPTTLSPLSTLESRLSMRGYVINYFRGESESFTSGDAAAVASHGSVPLITLELFSPGNAGGQPS